MNLSYDDFGTRIPINVWISPHQEPLNFSETILWIHVESHTNASMTKVIKFNRSNDEPRSISFDFYPKVQPKAKQLKLSLNMKTNAENPIAFKVFIEENPINTDIGVVAAISILIFFNILLNAEVNEDHILALDKKVKVNDSKYRVRQLLDSSPDGGRRFYNIHIDRSVSRTK